MNATEMAEFRERIWRLIHLIPQGRVCTYGQLAALAGHPAHARLVGRILAELPPGSRLPWQRVVNASGRLSSPSAAEQAQRLTREGVVVDKLRVNLRRFRWQTA